ncbi:MAG: hypothetical protein ACR2RL_05985 [Gammaproteobacteria bacterium]
MHRRSLLKLGIAAASVVAATGHTPYKQWKVYRQKHLLIGTSRADEPTYPLGKRIARLLEQHLPQSKARVARARTVHRLVSLLSTGQIPVLLVSVPDAVAIAAGEQAFEAFGPLDVRALYRVGDHLLVTRADFPGHHAWMLVHTLSEYGATLPGARMPSAADSPVEIHPGALAFARGEALPGE